MSQENTQEAKRQEPTTKKTARDVFVFMGPNLCGKGTIAGLSKEKRGFVTVSTGDLFREHKSKGTDLGKLVQSYLDQGKLVPDEVTIKVLTDWFDTLPVGEGSIILDGYPRTATQAQSLIDYLKDKPAYNLRGVVRFTAPEKTIIDRAIVRRVCSKCGKIYSLTVKPPKKENVCDVCGSALIHRADDQPEFVKRRYAEYMQLENSIVEFFGARGFKIYTIPVDQPIEKVYEAFVAVSA